jgi:hypothetical protein
MMTLKPLNSFKRFELEFKSLASFLIVNNPYWQAISEEDLWKREELKAEHTRITSALKFDPITKEFNTRRFEENISYMGRELIYIRIVSALEVFLIQAIRDVFKHTTEPFFSNEKTIELNHSQILNFDSLSELKNMLLQRETRPLSSGGFDDVVKYYKKQLKIDISGLGPGVTKMKYYHQIRHILVHRLGKVDKQFKKQNNYTKAYLQIDELLLINVLNDMYDYALKVSEAVQVLIDKHRRLTVHKAFKGQRYHIGFDSKINDKVGFVDPKFHFWVGDDIFYLQDIGLKITIKGSRYEMEIWGENEVVTAYRKRIKKIMETSKYFSNVVVKPIPQPKEFDESIIVAVSKLLPSGIWPLDLRKQVAASLDLSNSSLDKIIKILNGRGMHLKPNE